MEKNSNITHDPCRQINYLRQVLSHNKKPLAFLLGAGCPTAISHPSESEKKLIPNIEDLTKDIVEIFNKHKHKNLFHTLYGHFSEDGTASPNIEQILSHIRSLEQVCGSSIVRGLSSQNLKDLEKAICDEICKVMTQKLPHSNTPYHNLATWMSMQTEIPIEIFTTNYDLLIEQALEETGIPYFDGFVGAREPFFDTHAVESDILPSRWARLWKIHGSINWYQTNPKEPVTRGGCFDESKSKVMIHPSHLKYDESRKMPYLTLLDKLKTFLKQPSSGLIICGYSFGDKHINDIIIQGLKGNSKSIAFALLYGSIEKYKDAIELANYRGNLSLLAEDEGLIGTRRGKWNSDGNETSLTGISYIRKDDKIESVKFELGDFKKLGDFLIEFIDEDKDINEQIKS